MILYNAVILKNPTSFKKADGSNQLSSAEITSHTQALADFEENFKADATKIDRIFLSETTFITELSYTDFKAKVTLPVLWSNVNFEEDAGSYELYLLE